MNDDLSVYLAKYTAYVEEEAYWHISEHDYTYHLRIRNFATDELPPDGYATSVRCLLFQGDKIMLMHSSFGDTHIVPGGRIEGGESYNDTLRRELLEETGWTVKSSQFIGTRHFKHMKPKPHFYPPTYHFPHFLQVVYFAEAAAFVEGAKLEDDYELSGEFMPIDDVQKLTLTPGELLYLKTALEKRKK
ncbi:MAG: NUDIX hydrolase [Aggregatilineales bacterium]